MTESSDGSLASTKKASNRSEVFPRKNQSFTLGSKDISKSEINKIIFGDKKTAANPIRIHSDIKDNVEPSISPTDKDFNVQIASGDQNIRGYSYNTDIPSVTYDTVFNATFSVFRTPPKKTHVIDVLKDNPERNKKSKSNTENTTENTSPYEPLYKRQRSSSSPGCLERRKIQKITSNDNFHPHNSYNLNDSKISSPPFPPQEINTQPNPNKIILHKPCSRLYLTTWKKYKCTLKQNIMLTKSTK